MTLRELLDDDPSVRIHALHELPPGEAAAYAVRDVLLGDDDASVRAGAAAWLGRAKAAFVVPALFDALYDSHPSVRLEACRALGRVPKSAAEPALAILRRLALEEPIWWARRGAVLAVARIA